MIIVNAGAIQPLVNLLSTGTLKAKEQSAGALLTLAVNNPHNQLAIAIGLVALLNSGDTDAEEHVTRLMLRLVEDTATRREVAKAGAIMQLVKQLRSTSTTVQELAASVLTHLAADGAANVAECAEAGGIKSLVQLLASESAIAKARSALVLADMTKGSSNQSVENQYAVVKEGGVAPLVTLLTSESSEGRAAAAGALWSLAKGDRPTQAAVADDGAVVPLVALLRPRTRRSNSSVRRHCWSGRG